MKVEICECGKILYSEDDLEDHALEDNCIYARLKFFTPLIDKIFADCLKKKKEFVSFKDVEWKNFQFFIWQEIFKDKKLTDIFTKN